MQKHIILEKPIESEVPEIEHDMVTAVRILSNYWKADAIEEMLISGQQLWTPYATFEIKK